MLCDVVDIGTGIVSDHMCTFIVELCLLGWGIFVCGAGVIILPRTTDTGTLYVIFSTCSNVLYLQNTASIYSSQ